MITIYTDGASRGNPGPGGWGAVIASEDRIIEIGGSESHTTNNRMELSAAIKALEFISKLEAKSYKLKAQIYTDSEYVMKGMTEWINNWQKKNWKTAKKKKVLNQDLWQELLKLTKDRNIEWKHVRGHAGIRLNERADIIATAFADALNPRLYDGPRNQYK